jgi:hypothetical protein
MAAPEATAILPPQATSIASQSLPTQASIASNSPEASLALDPEAPITISIPANLEAGRLLFLVDDRLAQLKFPDGALTLVAAPVISVTVSQDGAFSAITRGQKSNPAGNEFVDLALIDMQSLVTRTLLEDLPSLEFLAISPTGDQLAFKTSAQRDLFYLLPTAEQSQAAPIAMRCAATSEHPCSPPVWSSDGKWLAWSDAKGVWLTDPTSNSTHHLAKDSLEVSDPRGDSSQVAVYYDRLSWSPTGRYLQAVVRRVNGGAHWLGILDTRLERVVPISGSYSLEALRACAHWLPDGRLAIAYPSDLVTGSPPHLETWRLVDTHNEVMILERSYPLPPADYPVATTSSQPAPDFTPAWIEPTGQQAVALGITLPGTGIAPVLYELDLLRARYHKLYSLPYDTTQVLWSRNYQGALILGRHAGVLFAPASTPAGERMLVDLSRLIDPGACCFHWLP